MTKPILTGLAILFCLSAGKAQTYSLPLLVADRYGPPSRPVAPPTYQLTLTIPAATEFEVQLLSGLHSRVSRLGDPVTARLLRGVYVDGRMALPPGSLLDGRITRIRPAGRMHRSALLAFRFQQISLPDGQAEPISAIIVGLSNTRSSKLRFDPEGYLKGGRASTSKAIATGLLGFGTGAVSKAHLLASPTLSAFLTASSAAFLSYEILWPRGTDVHVPPETRCRIRLKYPLTVRAAG